MANMELFGPLDVWVPRAATSLKNKQINKNFLKILFACIVYLFIHIRYLECFHLGFCVPGCEQYNYISIK